MKRNKKILSLIALMLILGFFVTACTRENQEPTNKNTSSDAWDDHIGCQEGEINDDGTCIVDEQNPNSDLFDQDLSQTVVANDINIGDTSGYLAKPNQAEDLPGVVMIHEWWGLNDHIKEMARILANEGYVVFAVDLYGQEAATSSEKAMQLATQVRNNQDEAINKMKNAVEYLKNTEGVTSIASLGWCFGGQQSLLLSINEDVDATVIYYGQLINDAEQLANIDGPVLGIFGAEDTSISTSSIDEFKNNLNDLNIENSIYVYEGVGHAFANPSGSNYAAAKTLDAWNKTVEFLNAKLKSENENKTTDTEENIEIFTLTGENYRFLMDGQESPTIRVKKGDRVRLVFSSTQGFHDIVIDEFDVQSNTVDTGEITSVEFTADKSGSFEYYCSIGSHRANGMFGTMIVE